MPAKIIVTESKGGSRISLLGASGKELLGSSVFSEPRAKGATLRALRGLLGDVVVEDHTLAGRAKPAAAKPAVAEETPAAAPRARRATTRPAAKAAKTAAPAKPAAPAPSRRRAAKAVAAAAPAAVATASTEAPAPKRTRKAAPAKSRRSTKA